MILENAKIYATDPDVLEQIFIFLIQDFSTHALQMVLGQENSAAQEEIFNKMIKKPVKDREGFKRVWQAVYGLKGQYIMNE